MAGNHTSHFYKGLQPEVRKVCRRLLGEIPFKANKQESLSSPPARHVLGGYDIPVDLALLLFPGRECNACS